MFRLITAGAGLALIAAPLAATTATASDAAGDTAARQAPGYSISVKANKTTVIAKQDTVKIRGKVRPSAAGEKVVLQQQLDGQSRWAASGTTKIKKNGTFLLKDKPSVSGTRSYRVMKAGTGKTKKSLSNEVEVVVYGWEKLGYRAKGPAGNVVITNATVATDLYAASIVTEKPGVPASIEYTLGKKCTTLRASYALSDTSATGSTGTAALKVDGKVAFASGLVIGQVVEDVEADVTDAFRVSFELVPSTGPDAQVVVGTPEVLCTK